MSMTVYEFLNKLNNYFPSQDKDEIFKEKLNDYSNCIIDYVRKQGKKYDYDKIFKQLLFTYKYKTFPSLPDIIEAMAFGVIIPTVQETGKEGEVIKRVINGIEYEFTIVSNSWDNVMTISELDADIARRTKKEG